MATPIDTPLGSFVGQRVGIERGQHHQPPIPSATSTISTTVAAPTSTTPTVTRSS
jgi:hypothetical protein